MSTWIEVLIYLLVTVAGIFANYVFVSWRVSMKIAEEVGKYREQIATLVKSNESLQGRVEEFIGQIAFLEGKINGRQS